MPGSSSSDTPNPARRSGLVSSEHDRILEAVKTELRRVASGVSRVETVGLVPQTTLLDSASTPCG
jgi:hypothetical protein